MSMRLPASAGALRCRNSAGARRLGHRGQHRHLEQRALPRLAVHADRAAHQLGQPLADRQAQAGAAVLARGGRVDLRERLEQPRQVLGRDADAGILHREADTASLVHRLAVHRHEDLALVRELDGVGQQVDEDLAHARGVAHQRLGRAVLDQVGQVQVLLQRARRHQVERVLHAAAQVEGLLLDLELADVGLRVVEDVVDDLQQRLAAGADGAGEVALVLRHRRVQQQRGHADHRIERRADLVAHVGQEQALGARRGLGLRLGALQRQRLVVALGHVGHGAEVAADRAVGLAALDGAAHHPGLGAVGPQEAVAQVERRMALDAGQPGLLHARAVAGVHGAHPAAAQRLGRRHAGHRAPAFVDVDAQAVRIGLEDAHRRGARQLAKACLAACHGTRRLARLGDVAQDGSEEQMAVELDVRDRGFGIEQAAVGATAVDVAPVAHAPRRQRRDGELAQVPLVQRACRFGQQHRQRLPHHLRDAVAEDALGAVVEEHDALCGVGHDHRVVGDGEQPREQRAEVLRREVVQQRAVHRAYRLRKA
jgi:hypothetical protein